MRQHRISSAAMGLAALLLFFSWSSYDKLTYTQRADPDFDPRVTSPAYTDSHPRVLFDAAHINFHTAEGNYKPLADLIRNDGYVVEANTHRFQPGILRDYRVLVVANALGVKGVVAMLANQVGFRSAQQWTLGAFTSEECKVVHDWVAQGGGLLLVADHTPAGSAAHLLASYVGVDMSNWFVEDDEHSDPDAYSYLVFTRENRLLLSHPVTEGRKPEERVNKVISFTGQSLKGGAGSVPFLTLASTAREYPTREAGWAEGRPAAGRAQGVALTLGKGRVVVLGEAAMLSAQVFRIPGKEMRLGMEYPGFDNRQLALNIFHWLSGLLAPDR